MYNVLSEDYLNENYPILNCEEDTILFFISKDGVALHSVFLAIKNKYKNIENTIRTNYVEKEASEGTLLLSKIECGKKILIMIVQDSWKTDYEKHHIEKGFEKISAVYKERGIGSIAIQEGIVSLDLIEDLINKFDLPKITYYKSED